MINWENINVMDENPAIPDMCLVFDLGEGWEIPDPDGELEFDEIDVPIPDSMDEWDEDMISDMQELHDIENGIG